MNGHWRRLLTSTSVHLVLLLIMAGVFISSLWPFALSLPTTDRLAEALSTSLFDIQPPAWRTIIERLPFFLMGALCAAHYEWRVRPVLKSASLAIGFAIAIELLQLFVEDRHARWNDLILAFFFGIVGSFCGDIYRRFAAPRLILLTRLAAVTGLLLASTAILVQGHRAHSLANWECELNLHLGNESSGDRGWEGQIRSLALRTQATRVDIIPSPELGEALEIKRGDLLIFPSELTDLCQSAKLSAKFSATMAIGVSGEVLKGPARIVSWSEGIYRQNFLLGEDEGSIVFRVASGPRAMQRVTNLRAPIPTNLEDTLIVDVDYNNGRMRIEFDGIETARGSVFGVPLGNGLRISRVLSVAILMSLALLVGGQLLIGLRDHRNRA